MERGAVRLVGLFLGSLLAELLAAPSCRPALTPPSWSDLRDQKFESGFLQRRVRKLSVPLGDDALVALFGRDVLLGRRRRSGLEGIGLRLDLEDQIDDVFERQVIGVRPVPAAPAQVVATFSSRMPATAWLTASMRSLA